MVDWISLSHLVGTQSPAGSLASSGRLPSVLDRCAAILSGGSQRDAASTSLLQESKVKWRYWDGDLVVEGNLDVDGAVVIDGDLVVGGTYCDSLAPAGQVILLGNLVADHVLTFHDLCVTGDVRAQGLFCVSSNQYVTEIGGALTARAFLNDQRKVGWDPVRLQASCYASVGGELRGDNTLRVFVPELMAAALASWGRHDHYQPDSDVVIPRYDDLQARLEKGLPIFREVPGTEDLPALASDVIAMQTDFLGDSDHPDPLLWALMEDRLPK